MDSFEIIAAVIGFLVYWTLSSRSGKKKEKTSTPTLPPLDFDLPSRSERGGENPSTTAESSPFEELLKQFEDPKNVDRSRKAKRQAIDTEKAEEKAKALIGDKYSPEKVADRVYNEKMSDYYRDHSGINREWNDKEKKRVQKNVHAVSKGSKTIKKKKLKMKDMITNPESVRNAVIMKEILDRKF
ncbi:hypothetical protein V6R21_16780 [Limibacter armeniacum]|uniref:hypothetical protein n=1 Tax=Limibacter armeniacum TaxID=466084 RepID=UPI002FE68AA6